LPVLRYFEERDLDPLDWDRLLVHSSRVRAFTFDDSVISFEPELFAVVAMNRPVFHILPYLSTLRLVMTLLSSFSPSISFLSPTLTTFALETSVDVPRTVTMFLKELQRLPQLQYLSLTGALGSEPEISAVVAAVSSMTDLRKITFQAPQTGIKELFHALSFLPRLDHVSVDMYIGDAPWHLSFVAKQPNPHGFTALNTLRLVDPSLPLLKDALVTYGFDGMHSLKLEFGEDDIIVKGQSTAATFSAIATGCPLLERLHVAFGPCVTHPPPIDFASIEPVLRALRLYEFQVEHPHPLDLSYLELEQTAKSVGRTIEVLNLNNSPSLVRMQPPTVPSIGLSGTIPFARDCRNLRILSICVDTKLPAPLPLEPVKFSQSIREIHLG
jgi:hypothetical protein